MIIDKFIKSHFGSAHLAESPLQRDYLEYRCIVEPAYTGWEDPITEKVRHEHRLRNADEKRRKDAVD